MKQKNIIKGTILLGSLSFFIGCETGVSNKHDKTPFRATESSSHTVSYSKPITAKTSKIEKIFSKSGTPGYYLQVGYFKSEKPSTTLKDKAHKANLPYTLIKKYEGGEPRYYALVGPYRSYNQANAVKSRVRTHLTPSAFVTEVVRP
jgi:cell division protein FtsN